MAYTNITCRPRVDLVSGSLIVENQNAPLPLVGNVADHSTKLDILLVATSTLLYPALLAITFLGELYLAIDWSIQTRKIRAVDRKIEWLNSCTDDQIVAMQKARLEKLRARAIKQSYERIDVLEFLKQFFPDATREGPDEILAAQEKYLEIIKSSYKKNQIDQSSLSPLARAEKKYLEELVKALMPFDKTHAEIGYCKEKSPQEIRAIYIERYKCAKICRQIKKQIDLHHMHNLLVAQIPVVGLCYLFQSTNTTKDALENSGLVTEYNNTRSKYPWFRPYK